MLRSLLLLVLLTLARPGFADDIDVDAADPFNDAPAETAADVPDPFNDDPASAGADDFQAREDPGVVVLEDPDTGGPTPANEVPIDGGLGWLAAAGAGYAIRTLRKRRAVRAEKGNAAQ